MEIIDSTTHLAMTSALNAGFIVYCRYGLPHLVCLPINRPDDPLLSPALTHLKVSDGYFAVSFFSTLHLRLNHTNIVSTLYLHVTASNACMSDLTLEEMIDELAYFVASGKLLVIPLYEQ